MAGDFDYGSLWANARDVLDVLDALHSAMLQLIQLRGPWAIAGFPPAFCIGKRAKPADYSERLGNAITAFRAAAAKFLALLAEDRFIEPMADMWPSSAPRNLTRRFSAALRSAPRKCAEIDVGDAQQFESIKSSLFAARFEVNAVVTELERRRPDLAERAYQRKRDKLKRPPAVVAADSDVPHVSAVGQSEKIKRDYNRGAYELVPAALLTHHQYNADGSILNYDPISLAKMERTYAISKATGSRWFKDHFGGHDTYKVDCIRDKGRKLRNILQKSIQDDPETWKSGGDCPEPAAVDDEKPDHNQVE